MRDRAIMAAASAARWSGRGGGAAEAADARARKTTNFSERLRILRLSQPALPKRAKLLVHATDTRCAAAAAPRHDVDANVTMRTMHTSALAAVIYSFVIYLNVSVKNNF